jgi:hypothetical protein
VVATLLRRMHSAAGSGSPFAVHLSGKSLLYHLHYHRGVADLGRGNEQVKVFRHDDVSVDDETVLEAGFFQDLQEPVAPFGCAKFRLTAITTARDEMQIRRAIVAMKSFGHPDRIVRRGLSVTGIQSGCDEDPTHSQRTRMSGAPGLRR